MFINMQMANPLSPFKCLHTIYLHFHFSRIFFVFSSFVNLAKRRANRMPSGRWMSTFRINCMSIAKQSPSGLGAQSALVDWWMAGWLADWRTGRLTDWQSNWQSVFSFQMDFREFLSGCQAAGIDISFEPSQRQLAPFASCCQTVVPLKKRQHHQYLHTLSSTSSNSCQLTQIGAHCSSLS